MKHAKRSVALAILLLFSLLGTGAQNSGSSTYKAKCSMCHGADGAGNTAAGKATKTPSFNSPEMR
nr:cytochrome c [Pseudacidobacterium ailaaui]